MTKRVKSRLKCAWKLRLGFIHFFFSFLVSGTSWQLGTSFPVFLPLLREFGMFGLLLLFAGSFWTGQLECHRQWTWYCSSTPHYNHRHPHLFVCTGASPIGDPPFHALRLQSLRSHQSGIALNRFLNALALFGLVHIRNRLVWFGVTKVPRFDTGRRHSRRRSMKAHSGVA